MCVIKMIKENKAEFDKLGITYWRSKGLRGKGGIIVVLDDNGKSNSHNSVLHPFKDYKDRVSHMTNVTQLIREVGSDVGIVAFHFGANKDKEIIDWIFANQENINAITTSIVAYRNSSMVEEFERLKDIDIPVFTASGNHYDDEMSLLAKLDWTITIGAWQENNDSRPYYSQYGKELDFVTYSHIYIPTEVGYNKLYFFSGTSCSTPLAATMLVIYDAYRMSKGLKKLTRQEAYDFMLENTVDKLTPGKDNESGHGLFRLPSEIPAIEKEVIDLNGFLDVKDIKGIPFSIDQIPRNTAEYKATFAMQPKYLVIHNTGNTNKGADANANNQYMKKDDYILWHFTVDENCIIQGHSFYRSAFHAGDGARGKGNATGIGIEIAENGDVEKAVYNAFHLMQELEKLFPGIDIKPHQFFSGKYCPRWILGNWGWGGFIERYNIFKNGIPKTNKLKLSVNGKIKYITGHIKNGISYADIDGMSIPIRLLGEGIGFKVGWDPNNKIIIWND